VPVAEPVRVREIDDGEGRRRPAADNPPEQRGGGDVAPVAKIVASVVATAAASPRAMGVMVSGAALATVVGVPVGTWAGQAVGWRGAFWALAVLAVLAAVLIGRFVPADEQRATASVRSEFAALRQGRLWLSMSATALITGGAMAAFSYITPLLTERAGIAQGAVPLVLIGYGVGALAGRSLGGRLGDRRPLTIVTAAAVSAALILLLLVPLSRMAVPTIVLVVLLGLACMSVPPVVTSLAVRFAGNAPTLAAALAVSSFNTGIALGSWVAGTALDSSLGLTGPALVGTVMVTLGLAPLAALGAIRAPEPVPVLPRHPRPARTSRTRPTSAMQRCEPLSRRSTAKKGTPGTLTPMTPGSRPVTPAPAVRVAGQLVVDADPDAIGPRLLILRTRATPPRGVSYGHRVVRPEAAQGRAAHGRPSRWRWRQWRGWRRRRGAGCAGATGSGRSPRRCHGRGRC
jgi:DHA1 family inner membrane transport protein